MVRQCKFLNEEGQWKPMMVLADAQTKGFSIRCKLESIPFLLLDQEVLEDPVAQAETDYQAFIRHFPIALRNILNDDRVSYGLLAGLWRARYVMRNYKSQLAFWLGVLASLKPAMIMIPGDRELGFIPPLLRAAKVLKVTSVICTSNIPTLDSVAAMRRGHHRFSTDLNRIPSLLNIVAKWKHPDQVISSIHGRLLFSSGWLICALSRLRMLSSKPWVQGGGNSDYVLVDGERKKQRILSLGVPGEKIRVIGDFAYDDLYHEYDNRRQARNRVDRAMSFHKNESLVVMAVPIFAEHKMLSWDQHLTQLKKFAEVLAKFKVNVLLSFHPKSAPERYRFLSEEFGFQTTDLPLSTILPIGDIFVCGNSSTIDWSILCGIPVVNIDYVGIRDTAFEDCEGVYKVRTPADFQLALQACLADTVRLREAQLKVAQTLAQFDGKVGERYLAFLAELYELARVAAVSDCQRP
jgi:glycosyltransferase involved in cell wall biosynthesis